MSFLLPLALTGLLTLPLILLLHLLRNRRERLLVSSLRLWQGLHHKRQGARMRTIPLSLMLLAQLLIAAALTFALAQPVFSFLRVRPQHTIFILDTTTSMAMAEAAAPATARRFDAARQMIRSRLQALGENDTFALISLNQYPQPLLVGDQEQQTEALQTLDGLIPGGTGVDLPAALTLANGLVEAEERTNQIVVLSDNNYSLEAEAVPPVLAPLEWQTVGAASTGSPGNQALVNVSARTQLDKQHRLFARIINYSGEPVNRTLRVTVDQQIFDEVRVQLNPRAETARVWTLPPTAQQAVVEIVEADSLALDNRAELLLAEAASYQALLVTDRLEPEAETSPESQAETEAHVLRRALAAQPGLNLTVTPVADLEDYEPANFDVIVFEGLPPEVTEWPAGNLIVIDPPVSHPLLPGESSVHQPYRPAAETASTLLEGIDLSGVYFNRLPQTSLPAWAEADLMAIPVESEPAEVGPARAGAEQRPLIFHGAVEDSRIVVWAFDLAASNLSGRLALPLLTGNTLASLVATSLPPTISVGEPVALSPNSSVELPDGRRLSQPWQANIGLTNLFFETQQPGVYRIYNENGDQVGGFAAHAGSPVESNPAPQFDPDLIDSLDTGAGEAAPEIEFIDYWPWLAGLALVVMTLEGWFAWRT